jgi:molybdenum cofactor cytidylyltransferase
MGTPKALLPWHGTTLLGFASEQLRLAGVDEVVVVLGLAHDAIEAAVDLQGVSVRLNLDEASGRSGSIRIGAAALPVDVRKVCVQSVDQPTSVEVLRALLHAHGDVVVPTSNGRRGHPVCFSGALLPELREVNEDTQGLRSVVKAHQVTEIEVGTDIVFWNLNDPQAYAEALARQ